MFPGNIPTTRAEALKTVKDEGGDYACTCDKHKFSGYR
jgi:hypothetical protein